jgi:hypothetical protein
MNYEINISRYMFIAVATLRAGYARWQCGREIRPRSWRARFTTPYAKATVTAIV